MDKSALRPEFFNNLPSLIKEKQASAKSLTDDERQLYSLSQTAGWRILTDFINNLLDDLNKVTEMSMAQGSPFEEIGRNAIVASLAKGIITKVIQRVNDSKEAAEKSDGTIK